MRPLLNVNFSGTGLPQSPLWWARLMPSWRWWSCWWSTRWRWWSWWSSIWCWWSWSCWWGGGWEWMPGRNLSGGESHFSGFFCRAFFSGKTWFLPPTSTEQRQRQSYASLLFVIFLLEKFSLEFESWEFFKKTYLKFLFQATIDKEIYY